MEETSLPTQFDSDHPFTFMGFIENFLFFFWSKMAPFLYTHDVRVVDGRQRTTGCRLVDET